MDRSLRAIRLPRPAKLARMPFKMLFPLARCSIITTLRTCSWFRSAATCQPAVYQLREECMRDGKVETIDGRLNGIQWRVLRTLLLALGAVYLAFAAREFYGAWVADHPSTENLKGAIGWVPGDSRVLRIYARRLTTDTLEAEPAVTYYLRAARANPVDFENWEGLATAYQMLGEAKRAEQVLRTGLALVPYSPRAAWRLANLLILDHREKEALPYLRSAARANPSMRPAIFDLQWRLFGAPGLVLSSLLPCDADVLYSYLTFLIDRKKLTGSYEAWRELHRRNPSRAGELSGLYLTGWLTRGWEKRRPPCGAMCSGTAAAKRPDPTANS